MARCLYNNSFEDFIKTNGNSILGELCDKYHGEVLTITREAWKSEISILKEVLSTLAPKNGEIIFEYDIPSLGKRIDVVLLFAGIVFCLEFKVGESSIQRDKRQIYDCADA